jgi:hypothetical protein
MRFTLAMMCLILVAVSSLRTTGQTSGAQIRVESQRNSQIAYEQNRFLNGDSDLRRGDPRTRQLMIGTRQFSSVRPSPELLKARKVPDAVKAAHLNILKLPNTGIFRLLADPKCEVKEYSLKDPCWRAEVEWMLNASSFSFRRGEHAVSGSSDITLFEGKLTSFVSGTQSIFVDIGDVPLNEVTLSTPGVKFLSDFKPETVKEGAERQWHEFDKIVQSDGFRYMRSLWVRTSPTYVMRSIRYQLKRTYNNDSYDTIVAFRVLSTDATGVTIIYRILDTKKGPKLEY